MPQQTRAVIANVLLGAGLLAIAAFVVTHFMDGARPAWRTDMVWLGMAAIILSRPVRGRRQRTAQTPD
jgi:hypothetical protein